MSQLAWVLRPVVGTRPLAPAVAITISASVGAAALLGGLGMIVARAGGIDDGSTSALLAVGGAASAGATAIVGARLLRDGRPLGAGLLVVAGLLSSYLLLNAAGAIAVGLQGLRGPLAEVLVGLGYAWFVVPLTTGQLLVLSVARHNGARGTVPAAVVLLVAATGGVLVGLVTVRPTGVFSDLAAPLAPLDSPVMQVVFGVMTTVWMAAVVASGLVPWWGIRSANGTRRHRLALTLVAGLLPVWTITLCIGLGPILGGDLGEWFATEMLAAAFVVPFPLAGACLGAAASSSDDWLRRRSSGILLTSFSVAVGGILAIVAVGVGIAVGVTGAGSLVPAVLIAVGIMLASGLVRQRWTTSLDAWLDPDRARVRVLLETVETERFLTLLEQVSGLPSSPRTPSSAAPGIATLSVREREVLALLSDGLSNAAIATRLYVSERTIDTHVRSIFGKLGLDLDLDANRRVQAAAIWLRATTDSAASGASTDGTAPPRP